jgi:hypothetical protein
MVSLTIGSISTFAFDFTSQAIITLSVVTNVSTATFESLSCSK